MAPLGLLAALAPAAAGAGALALVAPSEGLDRTSAAIGGAAAGTGVAMLARWADGKPLEPSQAGLLAASLLGLVVYDRWHDGMWPFPVRSV